MICISHLFIFTTRKSRTLKCFLQYQKNSTIQKSNITLLYIVGRIYSCISGQITIHPSLIKNFLCFLAVIIHWRQTKFWFKLTTDFTYNSSTVKKKAAFTQYNYGIPRVFLVKTERGILFVKTSHKGGHCLEIPGIKNKLS